MAEVGSLRDKNGNVKGKYRKESEQEARPKNRDRSDNMARKAPAKAEVEDLPVFNPAALAAIDAQAEAMQRNDYQVAITALNARLFNAAEAAATTKLEMAAYDAIKNPLDKVDLLIQANAANPNGGQYGASYGLLPPIGTNVDFEIAADASVAPEPVVAQKTPTPLEMVFTANGFGGTKKNYVSTSTDVNPEAFLNGLQNLAKEINTAQHAIATAGVNPVQQAAEKVVVAEVDATKAIEKMFAQVDGTNGKVTSVYQRSETLSAQDKFAVTLAQISFNAIGVGNFSAEELGHVAGGKTARITKEFNGKDRVIGKNTWAQLKEEVLNLSPEKAQAFVAQLEQVQKIYMADLVKESYKALAKNSPTDLPTPQASTNQAVGV